MDLDLKGKVALVTGAGSQIGFGKAIALTLAREGCDIIATDVDLEGAKQTAVEVEALGRNAITLKADVTSSAEVNDTVKAALKKFGKIDILVNNAGASSGRKPFVEKTETDWDIDINVNLRGVLNYTKAVISHMLSLKSGKIINISSGAGIMGGMLSSSYSAAKAGVIAFTQALAREVAPSGINVNSIAPGIAKTGLTRNVTPESWERVLERQVRGPVVPQDIANMAAFLASDVSSNIMGQTIFVGGRVVP